MLPWLGKVLSLEEAALLQEQDQHAWRWNEIVRKVLDDDHYQWYRAELAQLCAKLKIPFADMNPTMSQDGQWYFIDRVHMNDEGQDVAARALAAVIG